MRVMSYNTLFGGWDGDDARRFRLQAEVIRRAKPDVLLLQEGKHFDRDGARRLFEVERAIGMRGFLAVAPHTGQNTAVFVGESVRPVSFDSDSVHFHHAAAFLTAEVPGAKAPVTFISVHLCPFAPHVRLTEAAYLVNHAAPERLALVAGDFNSVSPFDPEPSGWGTLPPHFRARYLSADGQTADRRTLASLYAAGFADIAHRLGKHTDATVPGAAFKGTEFIPFRSDYVLTSGALAERATSYSVVKDELTDMASDHYPVLADFKL
jgi:endonuclease/exonuclease/phosphatase family metal-dependent hydrolase